MIYVVTSILAGWDNLRAPLCSTTDPTVRWICYTDLPVIPSVDPWEFRPVVDVGHPARTSRVPKILPHLLLPPDAEYSIWHDGNFQLRVEPRDLIGQLLRFEDWAAHKHPARDGIYPESEVLLRERIGSSDLVRAEIARYKAIGHPDHVGLWANGMIVRRHTPAVAALNELWWKLYSEGCERDQLSFPVARWNLSLKVNTLQEDIFNSPYMKFNWHAAWKTHQDNPSFWPERDRLRTQIAEIQRVTGAKISYQEK